MRLPARSLVSVTVFFAAAAVAWAETCTLELKRCGPQNAQKSDSAYCTAYPQGVFVQIGRDGAPTGNQEPVTAFKRLVKKEPKYQTKNPFRGAVKLGSLEFAFALDAVPPPEKDVVSNAEKKEKEKKKTKTGSATDKPAAAAFNRLYFDLNHNGDLTDDKPIEASSQSSPPTQGDSQQSQAFFQFPRVDVTIANEGTKLEYAFFLQGQSVSSPAFSYVTVMFSAAAYREGDVMLEGKKHRVVLIDCNSNGRFGDEFKTNSLKRCPDGRIGPSPIDGDVLLLDPDSSDVGSAYEVTGGNNRHYVSKMIDIDGRFYDVKISPAGDKLTLEPSKVPLGNVKNPNCDIHAVIYGDRGFLKIRGEKGAPIPVPEGEWKLLDYTLTRTGIQEPKKPGSSASGNRPSILDARATDAYKAVKVVKGRTVTMPFGPPYKPVVTADYLGDGPNRQVLSLSMSLVGSAGDICENLTVNGGKPSKPTFTITDAKGKVVEQGSFEYG